MKEVIVKSKRDKDKAGVKKKYEVRNYPGVFCIKTKPKATT